MEANKHLFSVMFILLLTFPMSYFAQEKSKTGRELGEEIELAVEKIERVSGSDIMKATVIFSDGIYIPDKAPAEKTQFDVILSTKSSTQIPVAGAEVMLEVSPQKKGPVTTGRNGNFGVYFSNVLEEQGKDKPNITLTVNITPPKDFPYQIDQNIFKLSLDKSKGPYYEFILLFEQDKTNPNNGKLIIKPNTTYTIMAPGKGIKQGKGSAVKTGDSYHGQVRHF